MTGLLFPFAELVQETQALQTIAEKYLDQNHIWALEKFKSDIQSIWSAAAERPCHLILSPLHTTSTDINGQMIYAVCSGIWEVMPLGNSKKNRAKRNIRFCGIASTKIELYLKNKKYPPIAMWRLEFGTHDSPGCYFHAQIHKNPPIPRLPSFFVTPMAAIEFVIGELFQNDWKQTAMSNHGSATFWRSLQRGRLICLLNWYKDSLAKGDSSPWMNLKVKKPKERMFISRKT